MDCFIKIKGQKKIDQKTTIHTEQLKELETCLRDGKNVFVCGPTGIGKTHLVSVLLNEENSIELALEDVSSKSVFLDVIHGTSKHILIENYEPSQYGFKSLIDRVSDGKDVTKGSLVVVTNDICLGYPNFETIVLAPPTVDQLLSIQSGDDAEAAAHASRGDIRAFRNTLWNYGRKDRFKTPKEYITDILCSDEPIKFR